MTQINAIYKIKMKRVSKISDHFFVWIVLTLYLCRCNRKERKMKRFTRIVCFIFLLLSVVVVSFAQDGRKLKPAETEQTNIVLAVEGNNVHVQNVSGKSYLEIYNVLGVKINSALIDSIDKTVVLNLPKGCYILKIQDVVRKIAIK